MPYLLGFYCIAGHRHVGQSIRAIGLQYDSCVSRTGNLVTSHSCICHSPYHDRRRRIAIRIPGLRAYTNNVSSDGDIVALIEEDSVTVRI